MITEEKTANKSLKTGRIYQVLGAVVDVKFENEAELPDIYKGAVTNYSRYESAV